MNDILEYRTFCCDRFTCVACMGHPEDSSSPGSARKLPQADDGFAEGAVHVGVGNRITVGRNCSIGDLREVDLVHVLKTLKIGVEK